MLLDKHQAVASMSRRGNCWDNAVAETFFGTFKPPHERAEVSNYIHQFHNPVRLHSGDRRRGMEVSGGVLVESEGL